MKYLLQRVRPTRTHGAKYPAQLTYKLQHRLTWFTDILRSYLTETVIFFTTQDMDTAMEKAEDIDEMSQIHVKYVARLQERAMLSKDLKPIHKAIVEILDLGVRYAGTVGATQKNGAGSSRSRNTGSRQKSSMPMPMDEDPSDSYANEESDSVEETTTGKGTVERSAKEVLQMIDQEFARLLPFTTAGLRSVGRAGAEPMWEQLAERLEWEGKRNLV